LVYLTDKKDYETSYYVLKFYLLKDA